MQRLLNIPTFLQERGLGKLSNDFTNQKDSSLNYFMKSAKDFCQGPRKNSIFVGYFISEPWFYHLNYCKTAKQDFGNNALLFMDRSSLFKFLYTCKCLASIATTPQIAAKIVSLSGHFLGKVIFFRQVEEEMLNHYRTLLWSSSNQNLADKVLLWQKITSPLGSHMRLSWYTLPDTPLQWILHHSAQFEMLSTPELCKLWSPLQQQIALWECVSVRAVWSILLESQI